MKKPEFRTACDTCAHLRGGPAGRDEQDTVWVWECSKNRIEFYESANTCPEQEYRADASEAEYEPIMCPHFDWLITRRGTWHSYRAVSEHEELIDDK